MAITYTSRKGLTYYLCRGVSKTGRPRYYFVREPKDEPVEHVPEGYKIRESINGIVLLMKDRPLPILPSELEIVEAELRRHPQGGRYRAAVKHDRIDVYEQTGTDLDQLLAISGSLATLPKTRLEEARAYMERHARFTPVLRFLLTDAGRRIFRVERICYLGSIDDWIDIDRSGPVERLAPRLIPTLGADEFFELGRWQDVDDDETTQ